VAGREAFPREVIHQRRDAEAPADNKSCDEEHPAGTHMGRSAKLTIRFPQPAYTPTFQEASRHSPAFSRKKACRA
jgi:hypothetical protein